VTVYPKKKLLELRVDNVFISRSWRPQEKRLATPGLGTTALSRYNINGELIKIVNSHKNLGVTVNTSLRFHIHIRQIVNKAAALASNFLKAMLCRSDKFMKSLLISHLHPLLEFASPVWNTSYLGDLCLLESVQRRWTKMIDGLAEILYSQCLAILDLYSVKGKLLRAVLA